MWVKLVLALLVVINIHILFNLKKRNLYFRLLLWAGQGYEEESSGEACGQPVDVGRLFMIPAIV